MTQKDQPIPAKRINQSPTERIKIAALAPQGVELNTPPPLQASELLQFRGEIKLLLLAHQQ
ncbi:MAG: hypothetical protein EBX35_14390 [Planctomycetia bacterium]|nr:hypothetical protein [Planctomycetia bacterium]